MIIPHDPYTGEETEDFKKLKIMISVAINKMQFGDVLFLLVNKGNTKEVIDHLTRFIYANRDKFITI